MSDLAPWPLAPVLGLLPAVARLDRLFPLQPLLADLNRLRDREWLPPRYVDGEGQLHSIEAQWDRLPLRSIGGNAAAADSGGPSASEFADTRWLQGSPGFQALLASLPSPLRGVRLMALAPGAASPLHTDAKCGIPWGTVRLHVPLITNPGALLVVDGQEQRWQPGELWYADFTRPHQVSNAGDAPRIHLVLDCHLTPGLLRLLPEQFRTRRVLRDVMFFVDGEGAPSGGAGNYDCVLPKCFSSTSECGGAFTRDRRPLPARIEVEGNAGCLRLPGRVLGLRRVSGDEYRFCGWTRERTLELRRHVPGGDADVVLRSRAGSELHQMTVRATARTHPLAAAAHG